MLNETIDPLQLVPHRVKVFKLIYESTCRDASSADDRTIADDVSTRRKPLDELIARNHDDFNRTKHVDNTADLR